MLLVTQTVTLLLFTLLVALHLLLMIGRRHLQAYTSPRLADYVLHEGLLHQKRLDMLSLLSLAGLLALLAAACLNQLAGIVNLLLAIGCLGFDQYISRFLKRPLVVRLRSRRPASGATTEWEDLRSDWIRYSGWRMMASITGYGYLVGSLLFERNFLCTGAV